MIHGMLILKIAISIMLGFLMGYGSVYVFNKLPIGWLSDETEIKKIPSYPWKPTIAVFLMFSLLRMFVYDMPYGLAGGVTLFALIGISMSDIKYLTVPDIYLILLGISSFGYLNFYGNIYSNILGLLVGFLIMFLINLFGKIFHKKSILGFGDVKLCALLGFIVGINGILIIIFIFSILSGLFAIGALGLGKLKMKSVFPLAPFISMASWIYIVLIFPLPFREEFFFIVL